MPRKKILIVASHPVWVNTPCSQRVLGFARYLPNHGYKVRVLSCEHRSNGSVGAGPEVTQCLHDSRAFAITNVTWACNGQHLGSRVRTRLNLKSPPPALCAVMEQVAEALVKDKRIDLIIATAPSFVPLHVARNVSKQRGIPWIADMRDIADEFWQSVPLTAVKARIQQALARHSARQEAKLYRDAVLATTVSPFLGELIQRRGAPAAEVIYNGFEPQAFNDVEPLVGDRFTIVYLGSLYVQTDLSPFFLGLVEFLARRGHQVNISVGFYGTSGSVAARHRRFCKERGLEHVVHWCETVDRPASLAIAKGAQILLHASFPRQKGIMTSKIFDYMAAGRPVLSVPGDMDCVDDLLRRTRAGVSLRTPAEVAGQLMAWYDEWEQSGQIRHTPDAHEIEKYTRKNQTAKLAQLLGTILA